MRNRIKAFLRSMAPLCGAIILTAFGGYMPSALGNNATGTPAARANTAVRDGSHDFAFLYGKWMMPNHRLKKRLAGSNEWEDFVSYDECRPLPGGIGDEDFFKTDHWKDFV
ncbi:MAG TPA: hypothetical protein VGT42_01245, partial [Gammaproteobacteria bacterium]|nr:hypothetical protein [Gammaproteobacteria bacterium]